MNVPASHPLAYFQVRDHLAADILHGLVGQDPEELMHHVNESAGVDAAYSGEFVERFLSDIKRELARKQGRR